MSRLQTRCVFASAAVHGLLLAALVVSSAFVNPPPKPDDVKFIKIFDASKITDDETQGGGNPNAASNVPVVQNPAPPAPIATPPPAVINEPPTRVVETPAPKPVDPTPPPVEKKREEIKKETPPKPKPVDPPKIAKKPDAKKIVEDKKPAPKPVDSAKRQIAVDLTITKKATPDPEVDRRKAEREKAIREAREQEKAEKAAAVRAQMEAVEQANRERRQLSAAFANAAGTLNNRMSSTVVEMPGPGGEAFVNYADFIYTRYYQAWQTPDRDSRTTVKVEIVVARDGRVISSNIIRPSGDSALDRSVRQALDRVRTLPPFPEGAKEAQRTFKINFELKSKRQFG